MGIGGFRGGGGEVNIKQVVKKIGQKISKICEIGKNRKNRIFLLKMVSNALGTTRNTFENQILAKKNDKIGKNRIRLGQVRLGQVRLGQVRLGHVRLPKYSILGHHQKNNACFFAIWAPKLVQIRLFMMLYFIGN